MFGSSRSSRFPKVLRLQILCMLGLTLLMATMGNAADRYWVASSEANWNDTANWSTTSGGAGGSSVPVAADVARFDAGGSGNCLLNIAITVGGLRIESDYAGTVKQGAFTLLMATDGSGFYQAGGVFAGGTADITDNAGFTLEGGSFTNTSAMLTVANGNPMFAFTGGSFSHNNGTLRFYCTRNANNNTSYNINISIPLTLKHLIYHGGNTPSAYYYTAYLLNLTGTGALIVEGDFTMNPDRYLGAGLGIIEVRGNVVFGSKVSATRNSDPTQLLINGTGTQTYTSTAAGRQPRLSVNKPSGSFSPAAGTTDLSCYKFELISGDFTAPEGVFDIYEPVATLNIFSFTGGTYDANNGTLRITVSGGNQRIMTVYLRQPLTLQNLSFSGGNTDGWNSPYSLDIAGSGSLTVDGKFTMQGTKVIVNAGTMEVHGNVEIGTGAIGGTTTIKLAGANQQNLIQTGGNAPSGKWTIDKTAGAVNVTTPFTLAGPSQDLLWNAGDLNLSSNTLTVGRDVTIGAGAKTLGVTVADDTVAGRFTVTRNVSGLSNAGLLVDVLATPVQVAGQTYTILSNAAVLTNQFASATWSGTLGGWKGSVDYSGNGGKNVTLSSILRITGSLIMFR